MTTESIAIGAYTISQDSHGGDPNKISIYNRKTSEGGEFDKKKFEEAVVKFFEENY